MWLRSKEQRCNFGVYPACPDICYAPPSEGLFGAADAAAFVSVKFVLPDGNLIKPRHGCFVAFRGVGVAPAERLAAADKFGGVLYGKAAA